MVETYFDEVNQLNVSDKNSLQAVVNETEHLLTAFQKIAKEGDLVVGVNLLVAAQHLEIFVSDYAKKHLLANGNYSSTRVPTERHLVVEIQTIKSGYRKDVAVPSDVFQGQSFDDHNLLRERIILPPKLFEKQETAVLGIAYQDLHELLPDECQYLLDGL
ncbi:uncharacterized protein LOC111347400 [Stylophora pistillata]|uniref:uncharacterized protein LOC111347400 n=1 Tax=Stylophora pistillata TaxID=50429 RepID=UPI000C05675D|nr:uncharacterized protein LOC111347400 [Stylophora pistillata]